MSCFGRTLFARPSRGVTGASRTGATEQSPQRNSIACKQRIESVEKPSQHRPASRCQQPPQTHRTVSLPEHLEFAHDASIWKDTVNNTHQLLACRAIA